MVEYRWVFGHAGFLFSVVRHIYAGRGNPMETLDPNVAVPITHIKCRQCGEDMPSEADRCPHCGQATNRIRVHQVLFVVGSLIMLVLLGVGYFMK